MRFMRFEHNSGPEFGLTSAPVWQDMGGEGIKRGLLLLKREFDALAMHSEQPGEVRAHRGERGVLALN